MMHFEDRLGNKVEVSQFDVRASLPVYCAEIIDSKGEVIDFIDNIYGHTALTVLIEKKRWKELP